MEISFGMIVSIILIIVFLLVASYAIGKFLGLQKSVQIGKFKENLQVEIDKIWKSSQGSKEFYISLPSRITKVCFVNFEANSIGKDNGIYDELKRGFYGSENLIFYPVGSGEGLDSTIIEHIDLEKTTEKQNPFCAENTKGSKIILKMDFGEDLITIR